MTATKGHGMEDGRTYSDADADVLDCIYSDALGAVAMGATKSDTLDALGDAWGTRATVADIEREALDAYRDALRCGVEMEDTDASWREGTRS